ncbi:piwi-like protein 1 [Dermacentor andersoni]|uniref:piwi-like protein 1 n=1 Tax=Dermacentor andersoni TaxID=34620 RepID=UPI003B3A0DD9
MSPPQQHSHSSGPSARTPCSTQLGDAEKLKNSPSKMQTTRRAKHAESVETPSERRAAAEDAVVSSSMEEARRRESQVNDQMDIQDASEGDNDEDNEEDNGSIEWSFFSKRKPNKKVKPEQLRLERLSSTGDILVQPVTLGTDVILARTISNRRNMRSVATKVAIQLNCKLGGEAWCLDIPLVNTMVVGYDTYHDSSSRRLSAGAFVASMNRLLTRWYSRVAFHATHQKLGSSLGLLVQDALHKYMQVNSGSAPDRIIFFRDGVSDGQIPQLAFRPLFFLHRVVLCPLCTQVREWEIEQIISSLDALFPGVDHKLAFVVVTKRITTRFFSHLPSGGYGNPLPGTVVDTEVTRPERYDYFLVSQSVRQGTVAPTHYNVIYDTTGLKPDHMQRLSYKLTHLYFNWPGTIRVPAPCQYAHKLAFLAGQSLHAEHSPRLASTLFYL